MRSGAAFLLGWAAWLGALSGMLWIWSSDRLAPFLLSMAAIAVALIGLFVAIRPAPDSSGPRAIVAFSLPTVVLALGIGAILNGLFAGLWLIYLGAEIALFGLAGVARELYAARDRSAR